MKYPENTEESRVVACSVEALVVEVEVAVEVAAAYQMEVAVKVEVARVVSAFELKQWRRSNCY